MMNDENAMLREGEFSASSSGCGGKRRHKDEEHNENRVDG
jgi:hypothetical protein